MLNTQSPNMLTNNDLSDQNKHTLVSYPLIRRINMILCFILGVVIGTIIGWYITLQQNPTTPSQTTTNITQTEANNAVTATEEFANQDENILKVEIAQDNKVLYYDTQTQQYKLIDKNYISNKSQIIYLYEDVACPDCIAFSKNGGVSEIEKLVREGAYLKFYPLGLIRSEAWKPFSREGAIYLKAVYDTAPNKLFKFLNSIYKDNVNDKGEVKTRSFKEIATKTLNAKDLKEVLDTVEQQYSRLAHLTQDEYMHFRENKKLKSLSPTGKFYFPFIYTEYQAKAPLTEGVPPMKIIDEIKNSLQNTATKDVHCEGCE